MTDTQKMTRPGGNLDESVKQKYLGYEQFTSTGDEQASPCTADAVAASLLQIVPPNGELVYVCIGSDRSTGDAYGPLVGTALARKRNLGATVYGTLRDPVHAVNLDETLEALTTRHPGAFVIAIDAMLGRYDHVGQVTVDRGSIRPGAGVKKELPAVGDCAISAVVNVAGFMEYFVLQNTRLATVTDMAEQTVRGIAMFMRARHGQAEAAATN